MITLVTTKMCIIHNGFRGFRVFSPASVLVILQLAISSNKHQRILDVIPSEIHQRIPFFCGSTEMIDKLKSFL
jgi:fructose-1,6-bisphosphatase